MNWWLRLLGRRRLERQLDAELRDHLERLAAEYRAAGLSEVEARRKARLEFGGLDQVKEDCRDARGTRWLEDFAQDVRYAFRLLRKSPTFTGVAVLSLALGIGANTAIFSLVDAVLLKTLPVHAPEELVLLAEVAGPRHVLSFTVPDFAALRTSQALDGLCAFRPAGFRVTTQAGPEMITGQLLSGQCSSVLGVRALIGRMLTEEDERSGGIEPVAVISHAFWQRHFAAEPTAVGRALEVQGRAVTIVGVTPPEFFGLEPGRTIDVSVPLSSQPLLLPGAPLLQSPRARWLRLIGRLGPGISLQTANADLHRIWRQVQVASRSTSVDARLELVSGAQGINDLRRQYSLPLRMLTLAVGVLLLLACANLGSLLLARGRAREHEIGLRLSLGASRGRIVRQLLTEAVLLSAAGGAAGLAFAHWGSGMIVSLLSRGRTPIVLDLTPDLRLLGFTAIVSLATGLILGTIPAVRATRRSELQTQLQKSTRSATPRDRLQQAGPIAAQAALSLMLVTGAGLFARSLEQLRQIDVGFDKDRVLLVRVPQARGVYQDLYARFESLPTVRSVTLLMDTPLGGLSWASGFSFPGRASQIDDLQSYFNFVGPQFFETMGIRLVEGRDFRAEDDERAPPVAVVNHSFARRYFPGRSALGERVQVGKALVEIVGVAKDVRYRSIRDEAADVVYRPYLQQPDGYGLTFAIRADMPASTLGDLVRRAVRDGAPGLPVAELTTLDAQYDASLATERLMATLSGFFGAMALLLVGMGVYGTLSYGVSQRTRELGVRLALGAQRHDITHLILGGALSPVLVGVLVGVPLSLMASRVAHATLFGVTSSDPATYAACSAVLLAVAAAAALVPAYRAARIDPIAALRQE